MISHGDVDEGGLMVTNSAYPILAKSNLSDIYDFISNLVEPSDLIHADTILLPKVQSLQLHKA